MKKLLTFATCITLGSLAAHDAQAVRPGASVPQVETQAAGTSATTAKVYASKHKSVFAATATDHNPFWPIGWVKVEAIASTGDVQSTVPRVQDFMVSTILLNDPPMAVINGKEMAEGEIKSLSINGAPVIVQLMAVQDGRVILRWQNQNLIVPLHRGEEMLNGVYNGQTATALSK